MRGVLPPTDWQRVMVLAPHPDDETLATGGLLQQAVRNCKSISNHLGTSWLDGVIPVFAVEVRGK